MRNLDKVICIGIGAVVLNEIVQAVVHVLDYNILLRYKAYKHVLYSGALTPKELTKTIKKTK